MPELTPAQIRLRDPLSEVTRNERRFLLGMSIVAIALVRTGLIPSKISALGIEFSQADQKSLLSILALITLYFLAAFILYASNDFVAWRTAFVEATEQWVKEQEAAGEREAVDEPPASLQEAMQRDYDSARMGAYRPYRRYWARSRYIARFGGSVSFLRAVFEVFPRCMSAPSRLLQPGSFASAFTQVTSMCANIICVHINRKKSYRSHEKKDTRFARSRHRFSSLRF